MESTNSNNKFDKILIMTVGLPRSGKSTWARQQNGIPIINPDSIRLAIHGKSFDAKYEAKVWETAHLMVKALFLAGHYRVILDATNIKLKDRKQWISNDYIIQQIHFDSVSKEECINRAKLSNTDYLIPVIERMYGVMQEEIKNGTFYKDLD
jgi:predicted kinase